MDLTFVDTGAFIALLDKPDHKHRQAEEIYGRLVVRKSVLVTSNHVVDETCTWLLRHTPNGHKAAVRFGETIAHGAHVSASDERFFLPPGAANLIIVYSTPTIERSAWELFARYDSAGFSFTDCVSFAVMQSIGINKAFSFDNHFAVMGFERL